ncbi:MAG: hypothetical protein SRB2_01764 [Desulfobacteraceae bacterium Eth-SRB2]|nr:MAG: hypothetical protein SRB2_01764 [Desulfobacteraceae bacterium Eth-SRB2]
MTLNHLWLHLKHYRRHEADHLPPLRDRLIPVPRAVSDELNNYLALRKTLFCDDNPYLFPGKAGKSISTNRIYPVFHQTVEDIGITEPARIVDNMRFGAPTPHSLRHSFAVNTPRESRPNRRCRFFLSIWDIANTGIRLFISS